MYCTTVHIHTHSLGDANFGFSLDFCQLGFPHRILLQTRNISGKVEILDISNIFLTRVYWKFNLKVLPAEQLVPNMKVEYVPGHWQHFPESSIDNHIFLSCQCLLCIWQEGWLPSVRHHGVRRNVFCYGVQPPGPHGNFVKRIVPRINL